jgi:hypothetical protein
MESGSELLYDWRFTSNQFLAPSSVRLTTSNCFQLNPCGRSVYVTSTLTREWVCCLQLLLTLASAVILGSESRGSHDHILLSNLENQVPVFVSPRNRVAQLYPPGTGFPFRRPRLAGLRWRYSKPPPHGFKDRISSS